MGRTLAKLLILGDGYHVSDRLPSFVLQLLTTDNCLLTADEALEALREWDPEAHAVVEERLKYSVADLAGFMEHARGISGHRRHASERATLCLHHLTARKFDYRSVASSTVLLRTACFGEDCTR